MGEVELDGLLVQESVSPYAFDLVSWETLSCVLFGNFPPLLELLG